MGNFTEYDYDALVERITNNLKQKENWGDAYNSSTGQTLIQIIADASDQLAYMLERRTQENYLPTARLRTSIESLANQMNYRPRRKVSASGTLQIRLIDDDGNTISPEGNIEIPRYTRIFYDDNVFVNTEDILITPNDQEIEFNVIEGRPRSESFDPNNDFINDEYIILQDHEQIEDTSLIIFDDNDNEWFDVRSSQNGEVPLRALSFAGSNDRYYDLIISNDGLRVVFGNNNFGSFPSSIVNLEWVRSRGSEVSIDTQGLNFNLEEDELQDDITTTPANTYDYEIVNITPIRGGLEEESIRDIQIKSPEYFKTGDRAVTSSDYDNLIVNAGIGGIVDVNTYGEQETGISLFNMNNIYVSYLTSDGEELNIQEEEELRDFIDVYKVANTHVVLESVEEILTKINLKFSKNPRLRVSDPEIYEYIRDQLIEYFEFEEGSIQKPLYYSEIVEFLQNLTITRDGVTQSVIRYLSLDIAALKPFSSPIDTQEIEVEISSGSNGDEYILTINEQDYSYTQADGDTSESIAQELWDQIDSSQDDIECEISDNVIIISSTEDEQTFTITNENSTTPNNLYIAQEIQIPPRLLNNEYDDDLLLRGSVQIIDSSGDIIMEDDGDGVIGEGTVDYITALVSIPLLPSGEYNVRYKHDEYDNIYANERTVVGLLTPKEQLGDEEETLSTIEIEL